MDERLMALLMIPILLFGLCLGGGPTDETSLPDATTLAELPEQTSAESTTLPLVTSTSFRETASTIISREETILRATTTRKATTTTISSSRGCSKCRNSNLSCGEIAKENGTDVICTCIKPLSNGEYSSCYISRGSICTQCYDGTACGQNNLKGALCRCDQLVGQGMYMTCFLGKPKCTKCSDGTACGDVSVSGKGCFCDPACHGAGCVEWDNCELR